MRPWPHSKHLSSLRTRLVFLVLLAVLPALGLIFYTAAAQRRSAAIEVQENMLRLVKFAAANQQQTSEGARQLLIALSQLPDIRQGNPEKCNRLLANLLKQYRAYAGFGVLDTKGNSICTAPELNKAINAADRAYFRLAGQTRDFAIGEYQIGRVTGKASVNFGYPVLDEAGQVKAVVFAALDLAWLNQLIAKAQLPEGSVLIVSDRKGTVLARYPDPQSWVGKSYPNDPIHTIVLNQTEGTVEASGLDGIKRLYAFTSLGDDPVSRDVHVRIGIPTQVAFTPANQLLVRNLTGLGLVTILALIAAWIGGDVFLLHKVKSLVKTAQQLRNGDLSARTELTDELGELGQLARAFDEMAETIEKREQAIAILNQDLQNRVDELQTLFEVIPIGIVISQDPEFKQVKANPAYARIVGIPTEGIVSYTPPHSTPLPLYKVLRNGKELTVDELPLRYAALHGVVVEGEEIDIVRADGTVFNLFGYAAPFCDIEGNSRGAVATFLDITERKRTEAELARSLKAEQAAREQAEVANRIKDEFLAVLSHELRTPLNPILGWTKLLRTGKLDEKKTAAALETIERNAKLQTQLIEDLLDISRILQGKFTLNISPVDLLTIIEAAKETVRLAAETKSIQIQTEFESNAEQVMGDPNRLQQVVWNLVSNAVKFTPVGGQVHIKLEFVNSYAQLQVKDTGKGISPEFMPYVFDTFRQADSSITRRFGGLGLGLAIVRHIVELHGGSVYAESPGEGKGATFTVKLPVVNNPTQVLTNCECGMERITFSS